MSVAVSFDPAAVAIPNGHLLAGLLVPGTGEIPVMRPSDGQQYARLPEAGSRLVDEAVAGANAALASSGWGRCAPRERARVLRRWADLVEADIDTLAPLEALGSTRPIADARAWDIPFTAEGIRFFAEYADKLGGEVAATASDHLGFVISEPYGVVGAIAPWNFPLVMGSWKVAPALAAGNAVVLKPSELTPFSIVRLAQLALQAGLPPGLFNIVQGTGADTGNALCVHPGIGKITFTGSTATGIAIMTAAARSGPKPVTLELGGKSPQLVFDDVRDLDRVAGTVFRAFAGNAGQVCVSGSRLLVSRRIAEPLVERLTALAGMVKPGVTWDGATGFAPIVSPLQATRIEAIVAGTLDAGAELLCGGGRFDGFGDGIFHRPTLLGRVAPGMEAVEHEIFGPVLTVQIFDDDEEAFALASHGSYGLAAGVHTGSLDRAMQAVRRIKAGTVWINRYGRSADFVIPTGGFGSSGIGKDLGRQAVEANLRYKSVLMEIGA